ncbi:unnamed protein product [Ectocarpus sp. CCAP 1310/34]|nr:unnamed protein product [Ectocarpus sp. CCAP 1310/34]
MQACMEQPGDSLGRLSAPLSSRSHATTGVEPAVVLAGQDHTITREVICQDSAVSIHGADMEWMRSAVFGEDTLSPVRVTMRLFMAGGEEKEDSDDAGTHRQMHPGRKKCGCVILFPPCALECYLAQGRREDSDDEENGDDTEGSDEEAERDKDMVRDMHNAAAEYGDVRDDDSSVQNLWVYVRSQIASGLRGGLDGVKRKVWERVDPLFFEGRRRWLGPLWKKVEDLAPTTRLISDAWNGHVDGVAAFEHRKADTKAATASTLTLNAGWEGRLRAWISQPEVLEAGLRDYQEEKELHYLSCIINHVEEVG